MTGLIYLVIIALWAAVLIPMWLRRHDQISEVRSTARFSSAMRSLGSHDQPHYALEMSGGPAYAFSSPANESFEEVPMARPTQRRTTQADRRREEAHRQAATRRAIVLGLLTGFVLVTLVAAMLGMAPKWAPILAAVPVVAFLVAAALTASERSSARSTARPARVQERPARRAAAETPEKAPIAPEQSEEEWENWNAWDDDDSWEAVPTTLPTYVDAPRASAVPRGIDRDTPGEWTGSAMVEQAQAMRARRASEPLADASEIDHYAATAEIPIVTEDYDARRAVNE